jgi:uncharacterized protein
MTEKRRNEQVIAETVAYVRATLQDDSSGHDWWHVYRVWKGAVSIGRREKADLFIVELAALLHDIADWKFHSGDSRVGCGVAEAWLNKQGVERGATEHVCSIISNISFKGAGVRCSALSLEGKVVQDADRLDALGAIGIGRTFAYGGRMGRTMHDPDQKPRQHATAKEYLSSNGSSINHFHEKLLLLKERMNTPTARQIAQSRHDFMEVFLERFSREWDWLDAAG